MGNRVKLHWGIVAGALLLGACTSSASEPRGETESVAMAPTAVPATEFPEDTPVPPTATLEPTPETTANVAPSATPDSAATAEPTATPLPTDTPAPTATIVYEPLFPIGSTADLTVANDPLDIEGLVEVRSATQIVIRDFVFLAAEAPGVDIRLGVDNDFSDEVAVSLKDITGREYEGRSLTLTLPDAAFDGRVFNSIGVFCFDTGDLFDYALFELPTS